MEKKRLHLHQMPRTSILMLSHWSHVRNHPSYTPTHPPISPIHPCTVLPCTPNEGGGVEEAFLSRAKSAAVGGRGRSKSMGEATAAAVKGRATEQQRRDLAPTTNAVIPTKTRARRRRRRRKRRSKEEEKEQCDCCYCCKQQQASANQGRCCAVYYKPIDYPFGRASQFTSVSSESFSSRPIVFRSRRVVGFGFQ